MGTRKLKISKDFIDPNNHVGENSYYNIGLHVLWEMNKESGMDKLFLNERMHFKK